MTERTELHINVRADRNQKRKIKFFTLLNELKVKYISSIICVFKPLYRVQRKKILFFSYIFLITHERRRKGGNGFHFTQIIVRRLTLNSTKSFLIYWFSTKVSNELCEYEFTICDHSFQITYCKKNVSIHIWVTIFILFTKSIADTVCRQHFK